MLWGGCNTVHYLYIRYDRKFLCLVLMLNGTNFVNGIPLTHKPLMNSSQVLRHFNTLSYKGYLDIIIFKLIFILVLFVI